MYVDLFMSNHKVLVEFICQYKLGETSHDEDEDHYPKHQHECIGGTCWVWTISPTKANSHESDRPVVWESSLHWSVNGTMVAHLPVVSYYAVQWLVFTWYPYPWSLVEITPVLTTFCGYYPRVHYFYVPWLIMTSQWVMTLLGMPHCVTTMGDNVTRDIHYDVTMDNDVAMCT